MGLLKIYKGGTADMELLGVARTLEQQELNFTATAEEIKGGDGPCYIYLPPTPTHHCECKPLVRSEEFDTQYGERTLYFAYCPNHPCTTYGFHTKEEALRAWEEDKVVESLAWKKEPVNALEED